MADRRLIDANALKEWLGCDGDNKYSSMIMHEIADRIDEQPTIDAVPVVHGAWMDQDYTFTRFTCTACGAKNHRECTNYCPNCGAKMDAKKALLSEFSAHVASMSDDEVRASIQNAERLTAGCAREEE